MSKKVEDCIFYFRKLCYYEVGDLRMNDFTFLTEEQIFGTQALDVIQKRGTSAAITDFAILLGGYVSSGYHYNGDTSLESRTGWYWTKTDDGDNDARVVRLTGDSTLVESIRDLGVVAQLYRSLIYLQSPRTE